ncbi:hypothetical protein [Corynebacterium belfantii]|uniref:hypothetical protein n=1 Tax=Corynebacterium belfantii TaxID=2014537 RepID=UPI00095BDA32|nr:hypothetical protein [Corynebacterium belfantii]OLN15372.1 hypothetical protein BUE64_07715 [Corynebacterium diphtheriae subsp. lausannense]MBG9259341.1 hypothetical protein [Corynebacterium belfantii]MBG9266036.1 hypothetical protein [Corynebacterium belfantii]MBG9288068.1 hypothetical protein [Corynebacterium belfantii]MBG9299513.1 hypothetical protein [Corynebacterium belfantii]
MDEQAQHRAIRQYLRQPLSGYFQVDALCARVHAHGRSKTFVLPTTKTLLSRQWPNMCTIDVNTVFGSMPLRTLSLVLGGNSRGKQP